MKILEVLLVIFLSGSMCVRFASSFREHNINTPIFIWSMAEILGFAFLISSI
jgi:hypothetical protein